MSYYTRWVPDPDEKFSVERADIHGYRIRSRKSGQLWGFFPTPEEAGRHIARLRQRALNG